MSTDGQADAALILATLQRGEIPPSLRPDWGALRRLLNFGLLILYGAFVVVLLLPLFVISLRDYSRGGRLDVFLANCLLVFACSAFFVISAALYFRRRRAVLADLSTGRVKQADGEIVWRGSNYRPRFEGQYQWSTDLYDYSGARPGAYRFYFLPQSGMVLLIEALSENDRVSPVIEPIRQALQFQLDDLDSNRRSRLSPSQRRLLVAHALARLLGGLAILAILVTTLVLNWANVFSGPSVSPTAWSLIFLGVPMCTAAFYLGRHASQLGRDAAGGVVWSQTGIAQLHSPVGVLQRLRLDVQGQRLIVTNRVWNALVSQQEYIFYLAPHSRRVLAIEPLMPPKP